tara:strand:- start:445 stop:828 length:384 start_codon:yes stop_codon:yes gene_type:complete
MLWLYALAALVLILTFSTKREKQVRADNYQTSNFEISPESRQMFHKMERDRLSQETLKKFLIMEDRFLEYEKDSACRGIPRGIEAGALDQVIRETFIAYDFSYHNKHLKQINEPNRIINPNLKCYAA